MNIIGNKHLAEVKFHLGDSDLIVEVSRAALRLKLIPDHGVRRGLEDDPNASREEWKSKEPEPTVEPEALRTFNAQSQGHEVFKDARKVEGAAGIRFRDIASFLDYLANRYAGEGAYMYPAFSLKPYTNVGRLAVDVAEAFADLVVGGSRRLSDLAPEKRAVAAELIKRRMLGLSETED